MSPFQNFFFLHKINEREIKSILHTVVTLYNIYDVGNPNLEISSLCLSLISFLLD